MEPPTGPAPDASGEPEPLAPEAALVFARAGRHPALPTRVGDDVRRMREPSGEVVPSAGVCTVGEIRPLPAVPRPYTHGSTVDTVLIAGNA